MGKNSTYSFHLTNLSECLTITPHGFFSLTDQSRRVTNIMTSRVVLRGLSFKDTHTSRKERWDVAKPPHMTQK